MRDKPRASSNLGQPDRKKATKAPGPESGTEAFMALCLCGGQIDENGFVASTMLSRARLPQNSQLVKEIDRRWAGSKFSI